MQTVLFGNAIKFTTFFNSPTAMIGNRWLGEQSWAPNTPWGPISALLVVVPLVCVSMIVGVVVFVIVTGIFYPNVLLSERAVSHLLEWDRNFIGVLSAFAIQLTTIPLILWIAGLRGGRRKEVLSLHAFRGGIISNILFLISFLGSALFISFASYALFPFEIREIIPEIIDVGQSHFAGYLLVFLIHVAGAPLSEEFVIRGFLFTAFAQSRIGAGGAAVVTSGFWTILHIGHPLQSLLVVFVIGILLSAVLWRTGNLWMCVICHAAYNLAAFSFLPWPMSFAN